MAQNQISPPITFNWGTSADDTGILRACSTVKVSFYPLTNSPPVAPQPPYFLLVYPIDGTPDIQPAGDGNFNWKVPNYSPANQVVIAMVDSKQNSGGVGKVMTLSGSGNCGGTHTSGLGALDMQPTENPPQCSDIQLSFQGGQPPYTLTVVRPSTGPINITGINHSPYTFQNSIQNGGEATFSLSDSTGEVFKIPDLFTSGVSSDSACLAGTSNPTSGSGDSKSGTNWAAVGGGIGAGVVVVGLLLAAFWFFRRRSSNQAPVGASEKQRHSLLQDTGPPSNGSQDPLAMGYQTPNTATSFHHGHPSMHSFTTSRASMPPGAAMPDTYPPSSMPMYPPPETGGFRITNLTNEDDQEPGGSSGSARTRPPPLSQEWNKNNLTSGSKPRPAFNATDLEDPEELPPLYQDRRA